MSNYTREEAFDDFYRNQNVIAVRSEEEMAAFQELLEDFEAEDILEDFLRMGFNDYSYAVHICEINGYDPQCIMFETKDSGDYGISLTFSGAEDYDYDVDYYGVEPFEMAELMQ